MTQVYYSVHCPKNNLNIGIKTKAVTDGAEGIVQYVPVWFTCQTYFMGTQTIQVIVDAASSTAGSVFVQRRTVSDVDSAEYMFRGRNNVTKAYNKTCTVYSVHRKRINQTCASNKIKQLNFIPQYIL